MSRETACKIFAFLRFGENFTAAQLAAETGITEGNAREWIVELAKYNVIEILGTAGDSKRVKAYLWGLKDQR